MTTEIWEPVDEYPELSPINVAVACTNEYGRVLTYRTWPADESERSELAINWKAETLRQFYRRKESG